MPTDWLGIDWPQTWTAISALASLATVFVLIVGAWVGIGQYMQARLEGKFRVLRDLSSQWESDQLLEARWRVNQLGNRLREELIKMDEMNERDYYTLIRVATFLEDAASLGIAGVVGLEDIRGLFGNAMIQHYFGLYEPYIEHEQQRQPQLFPNFRRLAGEETNR